MQATLNVRMDSVQKRRGDAVLKAHGISASEAIRSLWDYVGTAKEIPAFMQDKRGVASKQRQRMKALGGFYGIGEGAYSGLTDEEMNAIYRSRYEE